jgi:hypothetical protein
LQGFAGLCRTLQDIAGLPSAVAKCVLWANAPQLGPLQLNLLLLLVVVLPPSLLLLPPPPPSLLLLLVVVVCCCRCYCYRLT